VHLANGARHLPDVLDAFDLEAVRQAALIDDFNRPTVAGERYRPPWNAMHEHRCAYRLAVLLALGNGCS
jgi:hypothetical protein